MRCHPSLRTACSLASQPSTMVNHRESESRSTASALRRRSGVTVTDSVPGSIASLHTMRALGAATPGFSAKVQPPKKGINCTRTASCGTGTRVPGDISRVAAEPLPHKASPVDARQPAIRRRIAPIVAARRLGHAGLFRPRSPKSGSGCETFGFSARLLSIAKST